MIEGCPPRVLVVDDEESIRHVIVSVLDDEGCECVAAGSAEDALQFFEVGLIPDVALLDIVLPGMNGLDLLEEIKRRSPSTQVVMMTSHGTVETAIRAIRAGAYDFLQKPFDEIEVAWLAVRRAYEKHRMLEHNSDLLELQATRNRELQTVVLRLESLIDSGRAMAEFQSLGDLLDFFTDVVSRELNVDRVSLMLLDPATKRLRIASSCGIEGVDPGQVRVDLGEGIAGAVAQTGEPFLVSDVGGDSRLDAPTGQNLSNSFISAPIVLSLPIKSQQRVLGVINVTNRRTGRPFDDEDLSYLSGLSGQVAVAIERASHLEDLQRAYDSLKETQDRLVLYERLEAVGQTAAGVAHDFNNCLSAILTSAEIAAHELMGDDLEVGKIASRLELIRKISLQGSETIKRIQRFTKIRAADQNTTLDVSEIVRDAVEMTRPKWKDECSVQGRQIDMRLDLGSGLRTAGNRYELTQAIGNLIFNAVEAMPEGGTLGLATEARDGSILVEVSDTGVGMSPQVRDKLFDPFFTTKEDGHGLGTSIVRAILGRHGGEVSVESREGQGATFCIRLPVLATRRHGATRSSKPSQADDTRPARVLIVDDERPVLETWSDALQLTGQQVEVCDSGKDAIAFLERERFDVLVTDLGMPGMSGLELAARAKQIDPGLRVILLSGWAVDPDQTQVVESGVDRVLAKPCLIEDLLEALRSVRGATPAVT